MKEIKDKTEFIDRNPRVIFTDLVEIKVTEDTVCLSLGVKTDNGTKAIVESTYRQEVNAFLKLSHQAIASFADDGEDYSDW